MIKSKPYKPAKRLPPYLKSAVDGVIEEIWHSARTDWLEDGILTKTDEKRLKAYVLDLYNKGAEKVWKVSERIKKKYGE